MENLSITDEFEFIMQDEIEDTSTFEDDSNDLISIANKFIDNVSVYPDRTYQGISVQSIRDCLYIGETDIMPWKHVGFTIDVSKLKDVSGGRLEELTIPSFIEELESIGTRGGTEFGYNQFGRNNLKKIFIPSSLVVIAPLTFAYYRKLENVTIEKNSKLMVLGSKAFACCENINTLDLRNCEYLDEIHDDTFAKSSLRVLKLNSNINKVGQLLDTSIETIYIDNEKYSKDEFDKFVKESGEAFWKTDDSFDF